MIKKELQKNITLEYRKFGNQNLHLSTKLLLTIILPYLYWQSQLVIDWTVEEIKEIDITTRKHLTITGNFHPNGDVDKLYLPRSQGGKESKW